MTDKLYTPVNCKMVGEWLQAVHGRSVAPAADMEGLSMWEGAPELIREALAKEGYFVTQYIPIYFGEGELETAAIGIVDANGVLMTEEDIYWDIDLDPTARHALFAATVEYLEGKK